MTRHPMMYPKIPQVQPAIFILLLHCDDNSESDSDDDPEDQGEQAPEKRDRGPGAETSEQERVADQLRDELASFGHFLYSSLAFLPGRGKFRSPLPQASTSSSNSAKPWSVSRSPQVSHLY